MPGESDILTVELLGTRLQLRGGENEEAVKQACQLVYDQLETIRKHAPMAPSLQIALMTAINIADQLLREQSGEKSIHSATRKAYEILQKADSGQK